jgi:hypothetical protein
MGVYEYECPVRSDDSWGPKGKIRMKGYEICPRKLAEENNNEPEDIWCALTDHRDRGSGKWMKPTQIHQLWEATFKIAAANRKSRDDERIEEERLITPEVERISDMGDISRIDNTQPMLPEQEETVHHYHSILATAVGMICLVLIHYTAGDATRKL